MTDTRDFSQLTLLEAALRYVRMGWAVFPLQPRSKLPVAGTNGSKDATFDEEKVREWWTEWPDANIALATGLHHFVLDVDLGHNGSESLAALVRQFGPLPATRQQITGTGGGHYFFAQPGFLVHNSQGKIVDGKRVGLAEGLDVRGHHGYVVAAPSIHPDTGVAYTWYQSEVPLEDQPLAEAPEWLLEWLRNQTRRMESGPQLVAPSGEETRWPKGARHPNLMRAAGRLRRSNFSADEIYGMLLVVNARRCDPPYDAPHVRQMADWIARKPADARFDLFSKKAIEQESSQPAEDVTGQNASDVPPAGGEGEGENDEPPPDLIDYPLTDSGNGERIVAMFGRDIKYCVEMKSWFLWDGKRWAVDRTNAMRHKAMEMARVLYLQALDLKPDDPRRKAIDRHARASESSRGITNGLAEAERMPGVPVSAQALDQRPDYLNFLNGTINLRNGEVLRHDRGMLLTKIVEHKYSPKAKAPIFQQFLEWAMGCTNPEAELTEKATRLVQFVQRVIGYSITGEVSAKAVFVFYGADGNNGKTTLLTLFRELLGRDYASLLLIDTIMHARSTDNTAREDMADLRGARFVQTSEVGREDRLNAQRVKFLTQGMGTIKSRRLHEHLVEFIASHKLLMDCNYRPKVSEQDNGTWRRLIQVPFLMTISEDKIDLQLKEKMLAEGEGVLAWAVRGAMEWYRDGLGKPPEVDDAQQDWREHDDPLREFLSDWCEMGELLYCPVSDLMTAYLLWAKDYGEKFPLARRAFNETLVGKGVKQDRRRVNGEAMRIWVGVELKLIATQKLGKTGWQETL